MRSSFNLLKCPAVLLAWLLCLTTTMPSAAFTAKDVETISGAFNSAFYFVSGANGYFKDTQTGGVSYFWTQAEMIECIIDAYEWNSNSAYQGMITNLLNGFLNNNGSIWTNNIYNDDILWATIAFA